MQNSINKNVHAQNVLTEQVQTIKAQILKNSPELLPCVGPTTTITAIPPAGYYIDQPGKYVFGNDITWTPAEGFFFAAIVIQCDDVELAFQGHSLIAGQGGFDTTFGLIVLNPETTLNNVSIQNGTIQNMGLCALMALNTSNLNISNMTVEGLTYPLFELVPGAVLIMGADSFTLDSNQVKNVSVTAMLAGAFMLVDANNGTLSKCVVDTFTNNDGVACAYPYFACSGVHTKDCAVKGLTTYFGGSPWSVIGHTCIGFMPAYCTDVHFSGCCATEINGCCDDCHGMSLFPVNGASITNFTVDGVHDGLGPQKTGAKATGLEVYGTNVTVSNCQVSNITAIVPQDLQATGFSACGKEISFDACTATGVKVYNAAGQPDTSYGYGTGFGWAPDPRPQWLKPSSLITYTNCKAVNCQLGFDTWNHQDSTWINPAAFCCGQNHLIQANGTERVYSMNFCSELPDSTPDSPSKQFPCYNQISGNTYPSDWQLSE